MSAVGDTEPRTGRAEALGRQLSGYLSRLVQCDTTRGSVLSLGLVAISSVVTFAMLALLSRGMTEDAFGRLAGWLNTMCFLAVVAVAGQETMIVRSWGEFFQKGKYGLAKGMLVFGLSVCLAAALAVSGLFAAIAAYYNVDSRLILVLVLFLVAQTLCLYTSQAARIAAGLVPGIAFREIAWRIMVIVAVLAFMRSGTPFHEGTFFAVAAAGLAAAVVMQSLFVLRNWPRDAAADAIQFDTSTWRTRSTRMWFAAMLEGAAQYLDVAILALILAGSEIGAFFVAAKLAGLFFLMSDALGLYSSRRIALMYHKGERADLAAMLRQMSLITIGLAAVGLVAVLVGGDLLLSIFGKHMTDDAHVLLILCAGTISLALAGPAAHLLLLTGHEGTYVKALIGYLTLRYGGLILLGWMWGLTGAAWATALAMIAFSILLPLLCVRATGLNPSVLQFLSGFPRRPAPANPAHPLA